MLIKDANCIPFWDVKCEKLSKKIFLPIEKNLKINKTPNTFNYDNWFKTEHKINKYKQKQLLERKQNNYDTYESIKCHFFSYFI